MWFDKDCDKKESERERDAEKFTQQLINQTYSHCILIFDNKALLLDLPVNWILILKYFCSD
jgi:hypothetical protein